ncbi:acetyltransferase-like protein [Moraxella macacae 0408225]|uniref:Acetyltransferase-like protein n=1 Tax=Moraxella macacae 0408225 TaxID=1230338 RepID=L2F4Y1_9GAMM|nr:GNAT family N-acetyltransferase [Moraxella macacae]ELA08084.1 acetyltransferase-like protein [Moraxella macacae 0408225]
MVKEKAMKIVHKADNQRFETTINGHTAFLSYEKVNENTLNYNHTIVPYALGGRGVGKALAKFALDYACDHNFKIIPSCSFVKYFLTKNPEYADLVV